uniref:Mediator of RNA polymerase II transcription subunit 18 n=1 Tax=Dictyocaulus viviparus TaxID=29172 RepID=Q6JBI9_DICVI|nr:hypothetical protein L3ni56 isoform d [Dictyocaulus viviparus]
MDRSDDDAEGGQAALTSMPYQCQELILYGSVFADNLPDLERRLTGLCDPGSTEFHEHDLSFSLRTGTDPDVTIRLRRRFNVDSFTSHQWQFRYIGGPEPDQKCPVIVRKVIDSIAYSHLMMDFVKTLGLFIESPNFI